MPLFAWALIALVVSFALTALTVKSTTTKPASVDEFDFPQSDEGTPQAVYFGDNWSTGWQVLWYGNYRTKKIKSSGGKK